MKNISKTDETLEKVLAVSVVKFKNISKAFSKADDSPKQILALSSL